jgi:hypothetical protein
MIDGQGPILGSGWFVPTVVWRKERRRRLPCQRILEGTFREDESRDEYIETEDAC